MKLDKIFNQMLDEVSRWLPRGWTLDIQIDGAGGGYAVSLSDEFGDDVTYPSNFENPQHEVEDALDYAVNVERVEHPTTNT